MFPARQGGDLFHYTLFESRRIDRLVDANLKNMLKVKSVIGFEDQFIEFQKGFASWVQMFRPVETVGDQNQDQSGGDLLGEPSNDKGHEGIGVGTDVVHLVDKEDKVALEAEEPGFDADHEFFQRDALLVSFAGIEKTGQVVQGPKTRPRRAQVQMLVLEGDGLFLAYLGQQIQEIGQGECLSCAGLTPDGDVAGMVTPENSGKVTGKLADFTVSDIGGGKIVTGCPDTIVEG